MDLKKIHEFVHKHRHKFIFILFIILFFVIYCVFIPLPLSAEDFVSVGYTTTIFSQTHNFMDLVLNYHYPHGSVLIEALLYYPFFYTKIWLQTYTLIPLLVHFAIFLAFYWFNFKYVKKYYILLNLLFIFPSMIFRTLLHMIGSQHEALLANAILILFFINFLKKQNKTNLILLALMCGLTIFIETTSLIFVTAIALTILLIKEINLKKRIIYVSLISIASLISMHILKLIEEAHLRYGPSHIHFPITYLYRLLFRHAPEIINTNPFNEAVSLLIKRIPRLFIYLENWTYLLLTLVFFSVTVLIIINYFKKKPENQLTKYSVIFFIIFFITHLVLASLLLQVDKDAEKETFNVFNSRHEISLLIPFYLLLVFGGLANNNKKIQTITLIFLILVLVIGATSYFSNLSKFKNHTKSTAIENTKYFQLTLKLEELQKEEDICGFHSTLENKEVFIFFSKGRLLVDCNMDNSCPIESPYFENRIIKECKDKQVAYIIPHQCKFPRYSFIEDNLVDTVINELRSINVTYKLAVFGFKNEESNKNKIYVLYNVDKVYELFLIKIFKQKINWC
nr:hypothetical protein [Nanoarchaeota archaeon]